MCLVVDPVFFHRNHVDLIQILVPGAESRPQRVQYMVLGEACEAFIKPNIVPPLHSDMVAEPHVAELVRYGTTITLDEHGRCGVRICKVNFTNDCNTAPVLHGSVAHLV